MPRHRHGNFPTAGINFRARLVRLHAHPYAGVKASLSSSRLFAGIEEGRYVVRRACFERPPVPHARIFGRFHPVTPNVLKIPTEYDGKIPFIALIHFVGRRRDFGVTRKFRAVVKSARFNFAEKTTST